MAFSKSASLVVLLLTFVLINEVNLQVGACSVIDRSRILNFSLDLDYILCNIDTKYVVLHVKLSPGTFCMQLLRM